MQGTRHQTVYSAQGPATYLCRLQQTVCLHSAHKRYMRAYAKTHTDWSSTGSFFDFDLCLLFLFFVFFFLVFRVPSFRFRFSNKTVTTNSTQIVHSAPPFLSIQIVFTHSSPQPSPFHHRQLTTSVACSPPYPSSTAELRSSPRPPRAMRQSQYTAPARAPDTRWPPCHR